MLAPGRILIHEPYWREMQSHSATIDSRQLPQTKKDWKRIFEEKDGRDKEKHMNTMSSNSTTAPLSGAK